MKKLIAAIAVFEGEDGELAAQHTAQHARLRRDTALDNQVSLLLQDQLAKVSPAFAAELATTAHFVKQLEQLTRDVAEGAFEHAEPADALKERGPCRVCGARTVVVDGGPVGLVKTHANRTAHYDHAAQ